MLDYTLAPKGIFWTVQGEGYLLGIPMLFVRLAGCSVACPECDTNYRAAETLSATAILDRAREIVPPGFWPSSVQPTWVWITGGEPTDQDLRALIYVFSRAKFRVALATSGIRQAPSSVHWLSVSPHTRDFAQRTGDEVKIVPGLRGMSLHVLDEIEQDPLTHFTHKYLSPLAGDRISRDRCVQEVLRRPGWKLTTQAHKVWHVL